jgi:hypothetical protein
MPPAFEMNPRFMHFGPPIEILTIELIYFLLVVGMSLYIYLKTKEIYDLTKHRGIQHFRNIFLFFGLAHIFRILVILNIFSREAIGIGLPMILGPLSLLFVTYFSTMAIFSVFMSVSISEISLSDRDLILILNMIAVLSTLIVFFTRSNIVLILLQTGVFLAALFILLLSKKKSLHMLTQNKITFVLLFIFWVISSFALQGRPFPLEVHIPVYIISVGVFFSIFLRVRKRLTYAEKKRSA